MAQLFRADFRCTGAGGLTWTGSVRWTWTSSTMPTIVASTGGSAGGNGKLASLPRTQYTSSPAPAPVESVQISRFPVFCNSGVKGCTTSMRHPVIAGFLTVHQTLPTTRPNNMGSIQMHLVDNADDGVVDGSILAAFGHARAASSHRDHPLAYTRREWFAFTLPAQLFL